MDVDTTKGGYFSGYLPSDSGWSPLGGLHLITTTVVDGLGRTKKFTDPSGRVTYTVYNDYSPSYNPWIQEVRIYPGWDATTKAPTGPTQVIHADRAHGFTDTLTMSGRPLVDDSGVPTGEDFIGNLTSLSRSHVDAAVSSS